MKTYLVVFFTVLVAELGDKTQLATMLFAADKRAGRAGVFLAAVAALAVATSLAVLVGAQLGTWVAPGRLRIIAGLGFVAIGLWMLLARS